MKLFAALLALTLSLAGCGPVDGDPIRSGAAASDSASRPDAVTVAQLRQQAEQNGSLAAVLAKQTGTEATLASQAVAHSTVCMLVTVPAMLLLTGAMFPM